jgi:hypothetical protein
MIGLMMREEMDDDTWMRFVFEDEAPNRNFWMKNTLIPLDMIRADSGSNIVHIEEWVPPCPLDADTCPNYGPDEIATQYVLEVNSGTVAEFGIEVGWVFQFTD